MSYSVCYNCHEMVPAYEKYCEKCIRKHGLVQDKDFWKKTPTERDASCRATSQKTTTGK